MTGTTSLLEVTDLTRRFGQLTVLSGLDLRLDQGELLGVIGPNGAGKSTLLNLISGSMPPNDGAIRLHGEDITRRPAYWRARRGIALSYQIPRPFSDMTVVENLLVPASFAKGARGRAALQGALEAMDRTGLLPLANTRAGDLRLLDLKRLEVARALTAEPQLLLLDEIAGGLTDAELPELTELVRAVNRTGVTIMWIEHVVHALTAVASRLMCMTYGDVLADGKPDDVLADPAVRSVYLGIEPEVAASEGPEHA